MTIPIKKIQADIEDIAEELETERAAHTSTMQSEELHQALEDMRAGKSPDHFSADPEFQAAVQLHVYTSDAEIDDSFKDSLEHRLLQNASTNAAEPNVPFWKRIWFAPSLLASAGGVAVLAVFVVTQLSVGSQGNTQQSLANRDKNAAEQNEQAQSPEVGSNGKNENSSDKRDGQQGSTQHTLIPDSTETPAETEEKWGADDQETPISEPTEGVNKSEQTEEPTPDTDVEIASLDTSVEEVEFFATQLDNSLSALEESTEELETLRADAEEIEEGIQLLVTAVNQE